MKWDYKIDEWIIESLQKNNGLGRNKIYEYVDQKYRKDRNKIKRLSKDVFDKHIRFLLQHDIVTKNDAGQRGTRIEHFLTPEAILQLQSRTLDLIAIKNQNNRSMEITSEIKLKALYILILMFNHTTSFELKDEDEVISFLKPFHFKLSKSSISEWRTIDQNDTEVAEKERRHFQSRIESQDKSVVLSIHDYVDRYHGGTTALFNCQVRGMTKNSVMLNRTDKPFQHLSFSSKQFVEAFDYLCKNQILHPVRNSTIYRFIDNNLYFLLFFLEDLFTEDTMPVMRKIWRYVRKPTTDEKKWLVMLKGETAANRIIIKDVEHRLTSFQEKKREKRMEIKNKLKLLQEELDHQMNAYKFIIDKHKFLQYIFEIMFPEFLRHLDVR